MVKCRIASTSQTQRVGVGTDNESSRRAAHYLMILLNENLSQLGKVVCMYIIQNRSASLYTLRTCLSQKSNWKTNVKTDYVQCVTFGKLVKATTM